MKLTKANVTTRRISRLALVRHPMLRRLEYVFWAAGSAAAAWFVLMSLGMLSFQVSQAKRLETLRQSGAPVQALKPGDPFGKISIPRIGLSAMIAEGDDESTLRNAVGHVPRTATPWGTGNVALAGHRDTFFRALRRVELNDVIVLETPQGTFRYHVAHITVTGPQHVELLHASDSDLTLITCFPFRYVGSAPNRFVVQALRLPRQ